MAALQPYAGDYAYLLLVESFRLLAPSSMGGFERDFCGIFLVFSDIYVNV